eukprot:scpid95763/ scgid25055/ 
MHSAPWRVLALVALCSLLQGALGQSQVCSNTQATQCSGGWKSFAGGRYIYCPRPSGNQALIYAMCGTCSASSESLLQETVTTEGNITFDLSLCTQGNRLENVSSGFDSNTYCVVFLGDTSKSNAQLLLAKLNMLQDAPNITLVDDSQVACEIMPYPHVVPETLGIAFYNESGYDRFLNITDHHDAACIRSSNSTVLICNDGIDPMAKARNMLLAQPLAVLRYECNDCGLVPTDYVATKFTIGGKLVDLPDGATGPPFEVVLRLASYAADGGPRKAIFYDRTKCANVLNVSNAVKIFCPTVEYCENCVSYLDFTAADRGRNASDRFVRRGDKVLDQLRCFQVHDTYTSGGGVVFANVTVPEFNKTSSALYCLVFYDIAKRQGIVGVPLLKYGERSSEPSTMPPGDKKKNSSSAAVSLVPFSVAFLLSALSLLTQI